MYEPKSNEEIQEIGRDLRDFGTGYQQPKPALAKDMTLRDYFAGQIISNLVSRSNNISNLEGLTHLAFQLANEMMYERSRND